MTRYLRFLLSYLFVAVTIRSVLGGGWGMWVGFVLVFTALAVFDEWFGDDPSEPAYAHPAALDAMLYLALPALALLAFCFAWMLGDGDALGFGAWAQATLGWDLFANRAATSPLQMLGGVFSVGLTYAAVGTNIGHELSHRIDRPAAVGAGRALLALTCNADFAIEHVYGHHERLATTADPATARRGEHFYRFLLRTLREQTRSARRLETARLVAAGQHRWGLHDRFLRGWLMSAVLLGAFAWIAGWAGVAGFLVAAMWGRTVLEAVNYFEHYGLLRDPASPVEPRHSWNTNRGLSNALLFNLGRHSHHHAEGRPYWQLRAYPQAPTLPYGYLTSLWLVVFRPGWFLRRMNPLLRDWDARHATPAERALAERANRASGLAGLVAA